jgi:hypothetical protein
LAAPLITEPGNIHQFLIAPQIYFAHPLGERPMTTEPRPAPRNRRLLRWTLGTLALIFALLLAGCGYLVYLRFSDFGLSAVVANLDATDPGWRIDKIEAARKPVDEKDNAALVVLGIAPQLGDEPFRSAKEYQTAFPIEPLPEQRLSDVQALHLTERFAPLGEARAKARTLKNFATGRYPLVRDEDPDQTAFPSMKAWLAAEFLQRDAWLLAHEEKADAAVESCMAIDRAAFSVGDEPHMASALVLLRTRCLAVEALERVLAQGNPSEALLAEMQARLSAGTGQSLLAAALRADRACQYEKSLLYRSGKPIAGHWHGEGVRGWLATHENAIRVARLYPAILQECTLAIEHAQAPERELFQRFLRRKDDAKKRGRLDAFQAIAGKQDVLCETYLYTEALRRSAVAALACERYGIKHAVWPKTLDDLVKAGYLDAVPLDPYDGQPLRLFSAIDGLVLYSIGVDGVDDGAEIARPGSIRARGDVGFRIWNPNARRQPP